MYNSIDDNRQTGDFERCKMLAMINNTRDMMWSVDREYRLIASNNSFNTIVKHMTGKVLLPGDCVLAEGFREGQITRYRALYDRAFCGESFKVTEYTDVPEEFWSELSFYPIRNGDEIVGTACYSHDITDRRKAESELSMAHNRLLFHFENTPLAFIEWDNKLKMTKWSQRAQEIFGWSSEEYIALKMEAIDLVYEGDQIKVGEVIEQLISGNVERNTVQNRNYTKDGRVIWCEWFNSVLKDKDGKVVSMVSQVLDITDQKRAEEKIVHANRLYSFISEINHTIVKVQDEAALFREACRIAVDCGKFDVAWIGRVDTENSNVALLEECGMTADVRAGVSKWEYVPGSVVDIVLTTGTHYYTNDILKDPNLEKWRGIAIQKGWKSCIMLPIRKSGVIVSTFNILCKERGFFDDDEINLLREATDDISFALEVFENESKKNQMKAQLHHSEQRLKQAQSIAHCGSWELDLSTGMALWSEEACRMYGLGRDEFVQSYDSWLSFIHPEDQEGVLNVISRTRETLSKASFHHRIARPDGSVRHIFSQAEFELDENGQPIGLYGACHDVTETKVAELALAQSEANLRLIMDLIPQSIFAKNGDGKFLFANKSFASLYGLTPDELLNKTVDETIPVKSESEYFRRQDMEIISSGETKLIGEHTVTDNKGKLRFFETVKVPYTVALTNEKAVLGISMDITQQKRTESERSKMTADIVQRVKDLEQFSYIVSHNLRSPVANISGLAEILQIPAIGGGDREKLISELGTSVKKLDEVILDLNYILQIKHKESKQQERVRFSELVDSIKGSIESQIKNEGVQIITDFSAVDEVLTVSSYMYSIFFNLVTNSIKYRQAKLPPVISIASKIIGDKLVITYKDNGMGIDLEKRGSQVFGLYKRFHGHVGGKGMGLFMVKTQVESLGGRISIASEVNKGTEFTIEFGSN